MKNYSSKTVKSGYDHNCRWILTPYSEGVTAVYCEAPVKYKMILDDDDNKVRQYESFCPKHLRLARLDETE